MPDFVLGSQSAQRRNLLASVFGPDAFQSVASTLPEPTFDSVYAPIEIEQRLHEVVSIKHAGIRGKFDPQMVSICADTVVVVSTSEGSRVLGKPANPTWQQQTAQWFRDYYSGQEHEVWSAWQIRCNEVERRRGLCKTRVRFPELADHWVDWYIATGEPEGKAGGYGIQGHAAAFVSGVEGSLTNVIGLPLLEVIADLRDLGVKAN